MTFKGVKKYAPIRVQTYDLSSGIIIVDFRTRDTIP
jgi:hypothetical protein